MKELYWYVYYVSLFSSLMGVFVYLLNYIDLKTYTRRHAFHIVIRKNNQVQKDKCLSLILLLSLASFIADISSLMYYYAGNQGDAINNTYNLLQFILVSLFYHYLYEPTAVFKKSKVAWVGIVAYLVTLAVTLFFTRSFQQYLIPPRLAGNLIFTAYAIYAFIQLRGGPLVDDRQMSVLGNEMYHTIVKIISAPVWFNIGVLLYFSGSLLIAGIEFYIGPELFAQRPYIWIFHDVLNITKNAFFAIGIYHGGKYGMARRLKLAPGRYVPLEAN